MKILHVMNDSVPLVGGYTSRSRSIVTHQKRIGIKPFVVTSVRQGITAASVEKYDGITYFRTNWPGRSILKKTHLLNLSKELYLFYRSIRKAAASVLPDIIHAHSPVLCAIPALVAARRLDVPLIYEIRAFWEDAAVDSKKFTPKSIQYRLIRLLETIICRYVDRVVPISLSMKEDLAARGIPEKKIFVVPNGVDGQTFQSKPKNPTLAARLGLNGKTVLGYLGTFYDFEGIDDLIRAFALLRSQEKEIALLLIGGGEMENAIRNQVEQLEDPGVVLMGKVPPETVPDYYALMDMVIYPRKRTRITEMTTPLKPLEAMALGKPVICSAVGGLKELVGPGNGLFFPPGNDQELIHCCKRLMHDPALGARLAVLGRKRALEERNWSHIVGKYLSVYDGAGTAM
jgi:PEP-CTERM/exosortase A-associated glycosyltransferase